MKIVMILVFVMSQKEIHHDKPNYHYYGTQTMKVETLHNTFCIPSLFSK